MSSSLKESFKKTKMVFINIAWMKYYRGQTEDDKIPPKSGGGKYIKNNKTGLETTMFYDIDSQLYGAVSLGRIGNGQGFKKLALKSHFSDVKSDDQGNYVDNVLVVWCAQKDKTKDPHKIVAWWNNAILYRDYRNISFSIFSKRVRKTYNVKTNFKNGYLLKLAKRDFEIGRSKKDGIGFGQANIWYAEKEEHQEFKFKVYEYIKELEQKEDNFVYF